MNFYTEIESYIRRNEVGKKARILEENKDILTNYWNIGRILVEAQGGASYAKYGNRLIKEWSLKFTAKYGKGYDASNLSRFRQFYLLFPILGPPGQISWTNIRIILPIKEENKRNYYINLCITRNLSKRELEHEIKNNSYERLVNKPEKIEIVTPKKNENLLNDMKNPILIEVEEGKILKTEQDLEVCILAKLRSFFSQLGEGFAFIDHQYKVVVENTFYYIDILLFNINLNCYFVVELKLRSLQKEDKAQVEFYMDLMDKQIKKPFHNHTRGIIISKEQNKLIANFVESDKVIPLTYEVMS